MGEKFRDYNKLMGIIQELKDKPGKGELLLQTALLSPVINNRNMAVSVLQSWIEITKTPLPDLSPQLYTALENAVSLEVLPDVKNRMEQLLI